MMTRIEIQDEVDRFRFRGEFLHWLSVIEDHLNPAVQRLVQNSGKKKLPYLFGQKFEVAIRSVETAEIWTHPQHVLPIMKAIKPFVELRSLMAHGLIEPAAIGDQRGLCVRPSGPDCWETRKVMTARECEQMLREIKSLAERLQKQRLKQPNPPSSPPQPSPGAAGDP